MCAINMGERTSSCIKMLQIPFKELHYLDILSISYKSPDKK